MAYFQLSPALATLSRFCFDSWTEALKLSPIERLPAWKTTKRGTSPLYITGKLLVKSIELEFDALLMAY